MSSKHTPGPWTIKKKSIFINQHDVWDATAPVATAYGDEVIGATNACLIAAAPDQNKKIIRVRSQKLLDKLTCDDDTDPIFASPFKFIRAFLAVMLEEE